MHKRQKKPVSGSHPPVRTQRTALQSALLSHVKPGTIQLSKKLAHVLDKGEKGVELQFEDGTVATADLVVGADGIRSVCVPLPSLILPISIANLKTSDS